MESKNRLKKLAPVPIQMVNNDEEGEDAHGAGTETPPGSGQKPIAQWAADARVGECTIVGGIGGQQFAVWTVVIETVKGGHIKILKRYSEFDKLRQQLLRAFPDHAKEIPKLPPKKLIGNLATDFLNKRRKGLEFFISCVLLNPVLGNSQIVKDFVSRTSSLEID